MPLTCTPPWLKGSILLRVSQNSEKIGGQDLSEQPRTTASPGCSGFSWICWGVVSTMRL